MAINLQLYAPKFICRKCDTTLSIQEWHAGQVCIRCRKVLGKRI